MQPGPAEKCRPWPKEAIAAVAADLRAMPELQLCLIRERGPDFVQRVLKREERAGATSMPWLTPVLLHNHAIAEHLV